VLTRLLSGADNEGIGLGELAETFNELGQVRGVGNIDGDTHDGGHGVLHDLDAVSFVVIGDGTLLHEVLIDTDESDSVTARDIGDGLDLTTHHEDGSLDVLDVEVVLGTGTVVGSHDSDLLTGLDGTGENTTKSVESTLVVGGDHLGDEDHKRTVLVAVLDGLTAGIIDGTFVELGGSVVLSFLGRGQLHDDHLKKSLGGVDPLLEHAFEKILHSLVLFVRLEGDAESLEHLPDGVEVAVHDVTAKLDHGSHDELDEASGELLAILGHVGVLELLGSGVEVVVAPEFLHESIAIKLELLGVGVGETSESEGPSEEGGTEGDGTDGGVDLLGLTHVLELVSGDDDVGVLDDTLEVLVHGLTINLELEDTSVDLVDHHDGLDLLGKSLSEDSLSLDADTLDVIDDDESTISDSEGSCDLGGEVNVTWGVNQVDEVGLDITWVGDISLVVEGYTSGLNGDTTLLLVSTSVSEAGITSILTSNNAGFGDEGIGQGRFTVIDVGNHRHVTDVVTVVHDLTDLLNSEVGHGLEC